MQNCDELHCHTKCVAGIDLVEDSVQVSLKQEVTEVRRVRGELERMEEAVEAGLVRCEVTPQYSDEKLSPGVRRQGGD